MSDWGNEETATVDFLDERLDKRMRAFRPKSSAVYEEWPRSAQTAVSQRRSTA